MTDYPGTEYRYFSIDCDHDLSGSTLTLGLDRASLTITAEYVSEPSARLLAITPGTPAGMTRYWWRALMGDGQALALTSGLNRICGQLADNPESEPAVWEFQLPFV